MAFGNRITTTTNQHIVPAVVDTILNSNVLAGRILRAAKKWNGETMKFPVKYQKGVAGSSFAGFDTLPTTASDTRVNLSYTPKFYAVNIALPLDELSVNMTEEKVLDLAAIEMKSRAQDMADDLGTMFYADGTGNSSKDFLGLGAIVDDGSSVSTIGGLSRTTYPTLASTVTASSGTLTLAKMSTLYNNVTSGTQQPTIGITTKAVFSLYEQLLQPQERVAKTVDVIKSRGAISKEGTGFVGGTGYTGLFFKGFPIVADEKCTSGVMFFLNEDYLDFYALPMANTEPVKYKSVDLQGNDYPAVMGLGFSWSGWVKPVNSASLNSFMYLGGEFVTTNPKRHGKLTGITSV